jgi:enamine deaminase RidA (YjgF/YER057c/UK114 family)
MGKSAAEPAFEERVAPKPAGNYATSVVAGDLLFLSGHGPITAGEPVWRGRVPSERTIAEAREGARLAAEGMLATIRDAVGSLERIGQVLSLRGFVLADATFERHAEVMDAASDVLTAVLGKRGCGVRTTIGADSLPFGMTVEIDAVIQLKELPS